MLPIKSILSGIIPFLIIGLLVSCNNSEPANKAATIKTTVDSTDTKLSGNFYKRIEGTIANKAVVVHLQCYNGEIRGDYYYVDQGKTISLTGTIDSLHPNNLLLTEEDKFKGEVTGSLELSYSKGIIKGNWRSPDGNKNYLVDLKENYPQGSYLFNAQAVNEVAKAIPQSDSSPVAQANKELIISFNNGAKDTWLNKKIASLIAKDTQTFGDDIIQEASISNAEFIRSYKADVADFQKNGFEISATLNYEDYTNLSVLYNDNGFLVIDKNFYSFTGGAHGFGGDYYTCLDVEQQKKMTVQDVLQIDSVQLQSIVEKAYRMENQLSPTDSLNNVLFENHLATTNNFYFSTAGLQFVYLPYEVAPYAAGSLSVFVPYIALKQYLKPDFAARLHLKL